MGSVAAWYGYRDQVPQMWQKDEDSTIQTRKKREGDNATEIIYTSHLEFRLKTRNIPYDLPRSVFEQAKEHYYDNLTKHYIAIDRVRFEGRIREMALTYDKRENVIEIITIHPIRPHQKHNRVGSGRWKEL